MTKDEWDEAIATLRRHNDALTMLLKDGFSFSMWPSSVAGQVEEMAKVVGIKVPG